MVKASIVRNTALIGGLTSLFIGLWWLAPWLALTVIGAIAAALGIWSTANAGRNTDT